MDRLNFYKSFYENELKKKDDLDKSINIPILIISIIFGTISFIGKEINYNCLNKIDFIIISLIVLTFTLLCIGIYRVIITYNNGIKGYEYEILGSNKDYENYKTKLTDFYSDNKKEAEVQFYESIVIKIIECVDLNTELNIFRINQLFLAKKYIILSLIISFITYITYLIKHLL